MKRREVWIASDVEMIFGMMPLEELDQWAARIDRLAETGVVRGARRIRGTRDLFRVEIRGWVLLYRNPARGRRITIASLRPRRADDIVDELLRPIEARRSGRAGLR
jgi:hypothetical protein